MPEPPARGGTKPAPSQALQGPTGQVGDYMSAFPHRLQEAERD
ncbi:hypothetical protein A176_007615 [Myxococcus hansupus]|uniref:Uncharacterized protein n=1 Tax=Pseudomyxococcus hansupus TaxID=1297742 RepID=A0A0H4X9K6_9BACT|nr:hypothetical protein A176_007615 [Myxococcus hansupus]